MWQLFKTKMKTRIKGKSAFWSYELRGKGWINVGAFGMKSVPNYPLTVHLACFYLPQKKKAADGINNFAYLT